MRVKSTQSLKAKDYSDYSLGNWVIENISEKYYLHKIFEVVWICLIYVYERSPNVL